METGNTEQFIENELYTDSINNMLVKCANFIINHPKNSYIPLINNARSSLSVAHRMSRIYHDQEHRAVWNSEIDEAKKLLREAEAENVFA